VSSTLKAGAIFNHKPIETGLQMRITFTNHDDLRSSVIGSIDIFPQCFYDRTKSRCKRVATHRYLHLIGIDIIQSMHTKKRGNNIHVSITSNPQIELDTVTEKIHSIATESFNAEIHNRRKNNAITACNQS
jgi:hypothetical protein